MRILDQYIAKSFLVGYLISFFVLLGLRTIIDLFVNLDKFAKHADLVRGPFCGRQPRITGSTRPSIFATSPA